MNDIQINVKTTLEGAVERVFYERGDYSIAQLITSDGKRKRFKGNLTVQPGEQVRLTGRWKKDPKYGYQFNVTSHQVQLDMTRDGLCNYLASNPKFEGIGPKKAALIADHCWANFEDVLLNDPEQLEEVAKVSPETIKQIQQVWEANRSSNSVLAHLAAFGLSHAQASKLVCYHGPSIVGVLEKNPYHIIGKVPGFGFKRVDEIALKVGVERDAPERIQAALVFLVEQVQQDGHSYLVREALISDAAPLLNLDAVRDEAHIEEALETLLDEGRLMLQSVDGLMVVAHPETVKRERRLVGIFEGAWAPNPHFGDEDIAFLINAASPGDTSLLEGQRNAVANAMRYSISLMSGGAGSGKTFTIQTVFNIFRRQNKRVVLCAPTGKAAKRMEQVVGACATTIHRLLRYDGSYFRQIADGPLDTDLIIVDEFSMVDVVLASALFQCVDPRRTAVLIVGDHNQIEPVGPGNPLRDLIQSRAIPTTVLDQVLRQAGELKENSVAILRGEVRPTSEQDSPKPWYSLDQYHSVRMVQEHLVLMHQGLLEQRFDVDTVKDVQILTPTRKGSLGTAELNRLIQSTVQKHFFENVIPATPPGQKPAFHENDKVIQTKNDYDLRVMNGAVGFIKEVGAKGELVVDFEGREVEIDRGRQKNLELAYALTIHKSQGSEYPCAIVIAHEQHKFMNNRNLLYTAVTRARKTVILMGDRCGAVAAASKGVLNNRRTFLNPWLKELNHANAEGVQNA